MKSLFVIVCSALLFSPKALWAENPAEGVKTEQVEARRPRALPFNSVIYSIDEQHRAFFHMGKHKLRKVYITPETRLFLSSGEEATVEDLRVGAEVRGSTRRREDGHLDAVTVKIGAKERTPGS